MLQYFLKKQDENIRLRGIGIIRHQLQLRLMCYGISRKVDKIHRYLENFGIELQSHDNTRIKLRGIQDGELL